MKAFITGITGQDGYYLSNLLLEKGYEVHGIIRRSSTFNTSRIDPIMSEYEKTNKFNLHFSDLLDSSSLSNLINYIEPDEIYNLGAQSHVAVSFQNPLYTSQTSVFGPITILESIKNSKKDIKFYQASSSEMFGGVSEKKLNEESKLIPKSPYAVGKVFAHEMTKVYRESYDIFGVNGILFNHESPYRGETFVTRKITRAVGRIYHKLQSKVTLGNLEAARDWGFAGDFMEGIYLMMQNDKAEDWVLSTGESHTVKEFAETAFNYADLNWEEFVFTDTKYERPNEVNHLLGDSSKAEKNLGWKRKTSFNELVKMMVDYDLGLAEREKVLVDKGLIKATWENPIN